VHVVEVVHVWDDDNETDGVNVGVRVRVTDALMESDNEGVIVHVREKVGVIVVVEETIIVAVIV
jgi:hypothetical protein